MGNYLILLLPLFVMPIASRVVALYGQDFDVPKYPVTRLRVLCAIACYVSMAFTVVFWHAPGIHATWSFATLALFVTSLEATLRVADSTFTLRRFALPLVVTLVAIALWVGLAFPNWPSLVTWCVVGSILQAGAMVVLTRLPRGRSPAVRLLIVGYASGLVAVLLTPWVLYFSTSLFTTNLLITLVAVSATMMAMGVMAFVLETTAKQLQRTRDRISLEIFERTAELQEANQRLLALDQLKNQFLSIVSHELRTPLATIRGYGEFLEDEIEGPIGDGNQAFVRSILGAADIMAHKVDDLLDWAGITSGNLRFSFQSFAYDELLIQLEGLMHPILVQRKQTMRLINAQGVQLVGDLRRIQQVLVNLVQNASKFSPEGAEIEVAVRVEGDGVLTRIQDRGIGIPQSQIQQIFEPFFQVDSQNTRVHGGIGMGLSIAHKLVEAHHGWIDVESQEGRGTTFQFWLPYVPESHPSRVSARGS